MSCIVRDCRSRSDIKENWGENVTFHRFPKNEDIRKRWFIATGRTEKQYKRNWKVCSKHFRPECFVNRNLLRTRLKEDVVPTLNLSKKTDVVMASSTLNIASGQQNPISYAEVTQMSCPILNVIYQQQMRNVPFPPIAHANICMDFPTWNMTSGPQKSESASAVTRTKVDNEEPTCTNVSFLPLPLVNTATVFPIMNSTNPQRISNNLLPTTGSDSSSETMTASQLTMIAVYKGRIDKLQKEVNKLELIAKQRLLKLNVMKQQKRRLKNNNSTINLRLKELLEKEKVDKEYLMMLECVKNNKIIERYLSKAQGSTSREYSLELKKFAVTLHYLSPKAYTFVRDELKHILPHPNTISKWYRSLDCYPGFTKEALDVIKERVAQNNGKPLLCSLSMDEMAIRKVIEWDGRHYFGYANVGCDIDSDDAPLAKEALTFMVTTMNDTWKIPVGYFLLSNITSQQKALLVEQCLSLLKECGINVVSLTFDGAATNRAMCTHLSNDIVSNSFRVDDEEICFWPDPCHNIKLVRNAFADKHDLIDDKGQKVSWSHIELLNQIQNEEGMHLGTKLRDEHVNFVKQKMKVRLATQLLSQSVADALKYCQQKGIQGFEDCNGTIKFISTFNNLFDIMNSRSIHAKDWNKAANPCNITAIRDFFLKQKNI